MNKKDDPLLDDLDNTDNNEENEPTEEPDSEADSFWEKAKAGGEKILEAFTKNSDKEFEEKYNEMNDRYLRTLAEFDNYRKRTAKELTERYAVGERSVCEKLLPVIDNFERALLSAENKEDTFYKGIELISKQFSNILTELGVDEIAAERGTAFDPNFHNAVAHTEDAELDTNVIADVLQKGYIHKDKVLRHVVVRAAN